MSCRNISNVELRKLTCQLSVKREELRMIPRFLAWVLGWIVVLLHEIGNRKGGVRFGGGGGEDKLWVF